MKEYMAMETWAAAAGPEATSMRIWLFSNMVQMGGFMVPNAGKEK